MKNSFSLLELIIVILISSIVIISSLFFLKESYFTNKDIQETEISKIDLLSTKIFLSKNIEDLDANLKFENSVLYYKENILLENVNEFIIIKNDLYYEINITLKNKIKQLWKIKI